MLSLHSIFRSIQGEGPYVGRPAIFVRFAGCNLHCPLCDTDHAHKFEATPQELADMVKAYAGVGDMVVLTGGEPFRQDPEALEEFIRLLIDRFETIQVETNGTLAPVCPDLVEIVVSPKIKTLNPEIAEEAVAFKYVVDYKSGISLEDGLPETTLGNKERVARPPKGVDIFIQPADMKSARLNDTNTNIAYASCLAHGYRLCMQLHKIIGVE